MKYIDLVEGETLVITAVAKAPEPTPPAPPAEPEQELEILITIGGVNIYQATDATTDAVTGDIGPSSKTGEASYCAALAVNPAIEHNVGDTNMIYLYELWPDQPAVVDNTTYKLEPA